MAAALGAALATGLAGAAAAQVLDIAPDGTVATVSGPAVYTDPDAPPRPIDSQAPARPVSRADIDAEMKAAAERRGLSPKVVEAVAWRESRFNPAAVSPKGALGVMQLMPATARRLGVDPRDAGANIDGGAAYLSSLLKHFDGDLTLALAAYNAGPQAVRRFAGMPPYPETKAFVDAILNRLADAAAVEAGQGVSGR